MLVTCLKFTYQDTLKTLYKCRYVICRISSIFRKDCRVQRNTEVKGGGVYIGDKTEGNSIYYKNLN